MVTGTKIKDLSNLTELVQLDFSNHVISDVDSKYFTHLSQLNNLKLVNGHVNDRTLLDLLPLKHLIDLNISGSYFFAGSTLHRLAEIPIKALTLSRTLVVNESLAGLREIRTLEKLDISRCWKLTDTCFEHIIILKSLRSLHLCENYQFTNDAISQLHRIKTLKELDISGCRRLTEGCTKHLLLLTSLRKLSMTRTSLRYLNYKLIKDTLWRAELDEEWRPWSHDRHPTVSQRRQ